MTVAHASVTDGLFCETAPLAVANGQVWDGLFCAGTAVLDSWNKLLQFTFVINEGISYSLGITREVDRTLGTARSLDRALEIDQSIGYSLARWYTWEDDQIL